MKGSVFVSSCCLVMMYCRPDLVGHCVCIYSSSTYSIHKIRRKVKFYQVSFLEILFYGDLFFLFRGDLIFNFMEICFFDFMEICFQPPPRFRQYAQKIPNYTPLFVHIAKILKISKKLKKIAIFLLTNKKRCAIIVSFLRDEQQRQDRQKRCERAESKERKKFFTYGRKQKNDIGRD